MSLCSRRPLVRPSLFVAAILILGACTRDSIAPAEREEQQQPDLLLAVLNCSGGASGLTCDGSATGRPGNGPLFDRVLGGQHTYVRLSGSNTFFNPASNVVQTIVWVQNLTDQPLGTSDGVTRDANGVRIFFHTPPTNGVFFYGPDGSSTFTASNQAYFKYDEVLAPGGVNDTLKWWQYQLPSANTTFTFQVYVTGKQPNEGAPAIASPHTFSELTPGAGYHMCATRTGGKLYCWGNNNVGQLGDNSYNPSGNPYPTGVLGNVALVEVSRGVDHSCGLDAEGRAYCWGGDSEGTLGNGTSTSTRLPSPVAMPSGVAFASIYSGMSNTCALTASGQAYCWGKDEAGELGTGTGSVNVPTPVIMPSGVAFASMSLGEYHTCAISTTSAVYCWGFGGNGQLGDGTFNSVPTPHLVPNPSGITFTSVGAFYRSTCALATSGVAYCWGYNQVGEVGDGTGIDRGSPTQVVMPSGVTFTRVVTGGGRSVLACGLSAAGNAYCWGYNGKGQVGNNSLSNAYAPAAVSMPAGVTFTALALGPENVCGLTPASTAYCWGRNDEGQLGTGSRSPSFAMSPVPVAMP